MADPNFPNLDSITDPVIRAKLAYLMEKSLLQLEAQRWQARRLMAWVALGGIMLFTGCMLFFVKSSIMASLADVVTWFYLSTTAIIGAYIGSSAMTYIAAVKAKVYPASLPADLAIKDAKTPFDELENEIMRSKKPS